MKPAQIKLIWVGTLALMIVWYLVNLFVVHTVNPLWFTIPFLLSSLVILALNIKEMRLLSQRNLLNIVLFSTSLILFFLALLSLPITSKIGVDLTRLAEIRPHILFLSLINLGNLIKFLLKF